MLDTCDSISEIVFLPQKVIFFTDAQGKYFVANKQDIEELSIRKIIIIDINTSFFHRKRESCVPIEVEVM